MRSKNDQHGTLDLAYRFTDSIVALGQRRMEEELSLEEANRLAEHLGEAARTTTELAPDALAELSSNLRYCMDYRFQIGDDTMDLEEAMHIAFAFVAWSNGFGVKGIQLALAMQMVECSLEHVLPRVTQLRATIGGQCRGLVAFVQRNAGHVEPYRAWCAAQSERLARF